MCKHAKNSHADVSSFSREQHISCVHAEVCIFILFLFYFRVTAWWCHFEKLYTKYKAENNAVWTIYVKYDLEIYWKVSKFEYRNFEMENV